MDVAQRWSEGALDYVIERSEPRVKGFQHLHNFSDRLIGDFVGHLREDGEGRTDIFSWTFCIYRSASGYL